MSSSFNLGTLLGTSLVDNKGQEHGTVERLTHNDKDIVLLYFSASWCGPCRQFTPMLIDFYGKHSTSKKFEVVFVSSDQDESSFDAYFKKMPWLAIPFDNEEVRDSLSTKYKIRGIPALIAVDAKSGALVTDSAREELMRDKEAQRFPWRPKSALDILSSSVSEYVDNKGTATSWTDIAQNTDCLGLYFSAHWCPPCRGFTPTLIETYNRIKNEQGKKLEIVFVSSDRDEASFRDYFGTMPWLAAAYEDRESKAELSKAFQVEGIPTLVFIDPKTGKILNKNGRMAVESGAEFPFAPLSLEPAMEVQEHFQDSPCLLVCTRDAAAKQVAKSVAERNVGAFAAAQEEEEQPLYFGLIDTEGEMDKMLYQRLIQVLRLGGTAEDERVVLLNLPAQKVFQSSAQVSDNGLQTIVDDFLAGRLKETKLK